MTISKKDKEESAKVSKLIKLVNNIETNYVNKETDAIYKHQPFLISLLLGYSHDLKKNELEEISTIIFLIWEYFKDSESIKKTKISENQFNKVLQRNIHMLKYFEGEKDSKSQHNLIASDLRHLDSKALLTGIFFQFNNKKPLMNINSTKKGQLLIGMKSLIECFEEIIK